MREVTEKELGEDYMKLLKDWFNEDFVKENVCHLDSDHHPLKKFKSSKTYD